MPKGTTQKKKKSQPAPKPPIKTGEHLYKLIGLTIRCVLIGYCAHEAQIALSNLAGSSTNLSMLMSLSANKDLVDIASLAFGGAGITYGVRERRAKRRVIEHQGNRIKDLETDVDPERSSSGLSEDGSTHPDDL